jgi:hypothetical protein
MKKNKEKESKGSSGYSLAGEKRKLDLMRSKEYYSETAEPLKKAAYKQIATEEGKLKLNEGIRKQEEAVYKRTVLGRTEKLIGGLYNKYKEKRITAKRIMKKNNMSYKVRPYVPEAKILNHENKFFKNELNNEKRSLFFS